jgi:hypothetical protein
MRVTGCFLSVAVQSEREVVHMYICAMLSAWNPKDNYGISANVYVV